MSHHPSVEAEVQRAAESEPDGPPGAADQQSAAWLAALRAQGPRHEQAV